jgi:hypothetical protein
MNKFVDQLNRLRLIQPANSERSRPEREISLRGKMIHRNDWGTALERAHRSTFRAKKNAAIIEVRSTHHGALDGQRSGQCCTTASRI